MQAARANLERIKDSIQGLKPDRRPYLFFINFPFIKSITGVNLHEYFNDPKTMMDAQVETFRKLGLDGPLQPDYGVVAECSGMGSEIRYDDLGFPSVRHADDIELEELINMPVADPWAGSLMTNALEALIYMKEHAPSGFRVENSLMVGPFTTAATLRGISEFCCDVLTEAELVKELLHKVTQSEIAFMKEQERILGKIDYILLADDISSFFSDEHFREFVTPTYDQLYAAFPNAQRWLHNDGEAGHLAAAIADAGFKLWHCGTSFDIAQARIDSRGEVSLVGNLSPISDIKNGSTEEVKARAAAQLDIFASDPKFILGAGGYINYGTPLENLLAVIEAAENRVL